jgi:hypothetical protein
VPVQNFPWPIIKQRLRPLDLAPRDLVEPCAIGKGTDAARQSPFIASDLRTILVEPLSDARTPLADLFSTLLDRWNHLPSLAGKSQSTERSGQPPATVRALASDEVSAELLNAIDRLLNGPSSQPIHNIGGWKWKR